MSVLYVAAPRIVDAALSFGPLRALVVVATAERHCPISAIPATVLHIAKGDRLFGHHHSTAKRLAVDERGFQLWDTEQGRFWMPPTPGNQFHPWLIGELVENDLAIYGDQNLTGYTVLDCGANFGVFTRSALRRGAAKVVAIDLSPDSVECLRRNFASEIKAGKVIVYPKGVWDKDDTLTLFVHNGFQSGNSVVISEDRTASIPVPLTTIDHLVSELGLDRVDFIKMDIEGAEQKALAGARRTITRFRPRLAIAAYHLPDDVKRIPEIVRDMGAYSLSLGCKLHEGVVLPDIALFAPQ